MNLEFAIFAGALTAIYAGMKNIMDTVYVINGKRDLILDFVEEGLRLDKARKSYLLHTDTAPMMIGLVLFLLVYTFSFWLLGIVIHLEIVQGVKTYVSYFLYSAGLASAYALWIVITKNWQSYLLMKTYISEMDGGLRISVIARKEKDSGQLDIG